VCISWYLTACMSTLYIYTKISYDDMGEDDILHKSLEILIILLLQKYALVFVREYSIRLFFMYVNHNSLFTPMRLEGRRLIIIRCSYIVRLEFKVQCLKQNLNQLIAQPNPCTTLVLLTFFSR
jgi:hypothetical protein